MPEISPNHAPAPGAVLFWDGVRYNVGASDGLGNVQVGVMASVLPVGAATAAAQALALAQLQFIEDLRHALQSIATDRLIVRGEDQLFSLELVIATHTSGVITGAGGWIDSPAVPAGSYWVITSVCGRDTTTAPTEIVLSNVHNAVGVRLKHEIKAFAISESSCWSGHTYMDGGDVIRAQFVGGLALDNVRVEISGYQMTGEV